MKRKYQVIKPLKKQSGIYKISCSKTDKVYIGETVNLSQRLQKHFCLLRKNEHSNPILQNIFNKYGEETFSVDILEYLETTNDVELKTIEQNWQKKFPTCISLDSNEIYHIERSEQWKEKQRKILDEIRVIANEKARIPIIIYNIKDKSVIRCKQIQDGEQWIERKHINKNIKDHIYIPFNNTYVAFLEKDFIPENIEKIIQVSGNTYNTYNGEFILYNLITKKKLYFGSETQFSLHFSDKRNDRLYKRYRDDKLISWNSECVYIPKNKEDLFTMSIKTGSSKRSSFINLGLLYKALTECKTKVAMKEVLQCSKCLVQKLFEERTKEEWIQLINSFTFAT